MQGVKNKHLIVDGIKKKQCSKCKFILSIDDFYKSKFTSDGLRSACKGCEKIENVCNYNKNRESEIKRVREWQAKNPEKVKKINRGRHKTAKRKAWRAKWQTKNPEVGIFSWI